MALLPLLLILLLLLLKNMMMTIILVVVIIIIIIIIIIMFNLSLTELRYWYLCGFCCESRHQPDVRCLTVISLPGYLTRQYISYYSSYS